MRYIATLVSVGVLLNASSSPKAETLEEAVQQTLNPQTFDASVLDEDSVLMVTSGSARRLYDRDEMATLAADVKSAGVINAVSGFKVVNKTEDGASASIVYEVDWKSTQGNTIATTHLISHEIWQRQPGGWRRVFAVMQH
jgi:hypothetical protein